MKLVYLTNADIPSRTANSIHFMKMCSAFTACGLEVELIATNQVDSVEETSDPHSFYGVEPNFQITRIPWFNSLPGKYYLYALMSAISAVKSGGDVIYGRFLFGIYLAERLGKTVIFESHTDQFNRSGTHYKMIQSLVGSPRCKKVVVISEALRQAYIESFPEVEDKIIVAHDGADPKPKLISPSSQTFTAGYMGHLYKGKGMEIIEKLSVECPEIRFLIVGGLEEDLLYWKEKMKDQKNLVFTGFVPHHQTDQYLEKMNVALAPYLRNVSVHNSGIDASMWMSPLKIFEYMAAGKPIIASDLPVIREVLKDGKNALLCNPEDIDEWIRSIRSLQSNARERKRIADNVLHDFEASYSWKQRAERLKNYLQ